MEEIRGITWDLWGEELSHVQAIQRIVKAGFPIQNGVALKMFAIVEGESGEYLEAWHANVERWGDEDKTIKRFIKVGLNMTPIPIGEDTNDQIYFHVKSIDLGFMQFNVPVNEFWAVVPEDIEDQVEAQFEKYPRLSRADFSAEDAFELYSRRGFQPWFAYKPGTPEFQKKMRYGVLAFGQWLYNSFVDTERPRPLVRYDR